MVPASLGKDAEERVRYGRATSQQCHKQQKLSNRFQEAVKSFRHLVDKGSFIKGSAPLSSTRQAPA